MAREGTGGRELNKLPYLQLATVLVTETFLPKVMNKISQKSRTRLLKLLAKTLQNTCE